MRIHAMRSVSVADSNTGFVWLSRDVSGLARRKWSRWSMRLPESSKFAILLHEFAWVSLWFEPFGRWGSWNPTLYLSLNSSLLFLSDYHLPFFQGMEVAKRKKALRPGNVLKKQPGTWSPGSLSQLLTNIYQAISYFYTFVQFIWCLYIFLCLDFHVLCCSQICGRWTAMEVLTTSLASWQKSRQTGGKNPIISDCLFVEPSARWAMFRHVLPCHIPLGFPWWN